jgi:hypothetical protein
MQAKVEIISVAFAKQLLEQNCNNRPLSPSARSSATPPT